MNETDFTFGRVNPNFGPVNQSSPFDIRQTLAGLLNPQSQTTNSMLADPTSMSTPHSPTLAGLLDPQSQTTNSVLADPTLTSTPIHNGYDVLSDIGHHYGDPAGPSTNSLAQNPYDLFSDILPSAWLPRSSSHASSIGNPHDLFSDPVKVADGASGYTTVENSPQTTVDLSSSTGARDGPTSPIERGTANGGDIALGSNPDCGEHEALLQSTLHQQVRRRAQHPPRNGQ